MLVPTFTEGSTSGWPRIFIKVMSFFGFVVMLIVFFFLLPFFGLMITDMLVISALSIYFDSLWDYFLDMIYCCSKLNFVSCNQCNKMMPHFALVAACGNIT